MNRQDEYISTLLTFPTAWEGHAKLAMKLVELLQPKVTVDLGVYNGYSTFALAYSNIGTVYGVDLFPGDLWKNCQYLNDILQEKYAINNVEFIQGNFNDVAAAWDKSIDILHIDGEHEYEDVSNDFNTWSSFCHENSVILFHDIECFAHSVGVFFNSLPGYKLKIYGSCGLGILTQSESTFASIQSLVNILNIQT